MTSRPPRLIDPRRFGLFQLTLAPSDPTSYLVDGQAKKMAASTIVATAVTA